MASFEPSQFKLTKQVNRPEILLGLVLAPESGRVFCVGSDGQVTSFNLAAEKPEPTILATHESYATGVAWTGEFVVSGGYDRKLIWTRLADGKQVRSFEAHQRWIRQVVASPDRKTIASVGDDMVCRLWNAGDGKLLRELRGHEPVTPHHFPSMLYACCFSSDGKLLATADRVGCVMVWEVASGKRLKTLDASGLYTWDPNQRRHSIGGVRSVAFTPDGSRLLAGGSGKIGNIDHLDAPARIEIFDWQQGERTHEIAADAKFKGLVEKIVFSPRDGWFVAAGGGNGGFFLFGDAASGKLLYQDAAPTHVHAAAISASGDEIFAAGHNRVAVWRLGSKAAPAAPKTA